MTDIPSHPEIDDELLSAYLDDELSPEERARVDARLAADPAAMQLLEQLCAASQAMKSLPRESVGRDLRESILRRAEAAMLTSNGGGPTASTAKIAATDGASSSDPVTMAPGARREPFTRPTDQIIIFVDDANYEATDAAGKKDARHRADGEIVWHNKGEAAPLLVNTGKKPYRNLVVSLK